MHLDESMTRLEVVEAKRQARVEARDAIANALDAAGMNRYGLSKKMGVHRANITHVLSETCPVNVTVETLGLIAAALGGELIIDITVPLIPAQE
jgi:NAD-dependent oxidoreductase involved in siderophore biosynthesis